MLDLYEEVTGDRLRPPTTEDVARRVVPTLVSCFEGGRLVGIAASALSARKREQEVGIHGKPQPPPRREEPSLPKRVPRIISEKTFLDISLVDIEGVPLAGRGYKLQLPSGLTEQGKLGADAHLRKTNIDPGTARLTLLPENGDLVEASKPTDQEAPAPPEEALTFVEVKLVDDDGAPVPGQRYQVEFPDGRVETGTLDEDGAAFFEGVPQGDCEITFPDLDANAWGPASAAAR
jgi:hypothetical protein